MINPSRFVNTWFVRVTALLLVAASAGSWVFHAHTTLSVVLSAMAFVALVHTAWPLYKAWLTVAEKIQVTVVTISFSFCYLFFVPVVWLFAWTRDSLSVRKGGEGSTYWVKRPDEERTIEYFQRLG